MERHITSKYLLGKIIIIRTPFSEEAERMLEDIETSSRSDLFENQ
jgi:hypothetical protein